MLEVGRGLSEAVTLLDGVVHGGGRGDGGGRRKMFRGDQRWRPNQLWRQTNDAASPAMAAIGEEQGRWLVSGQKRSEVVYWSVVGLGSCPSVGRLVSGRRSEIWSGGVRSSLDVGTPPLFEDRAAPLLASGPGLARSVRGPLAAHARPLSAVS